MMICTDCASWEFVIDTFRTRPAAVQIKRRQQSYTDPAQQTAALSCLGRDGRGASLLGTAKRLMELERHICEALPAPIGPSCRVLRFEDGKLTLGVPAASHSAKLRQLAPRLVAALENQGWQVNGIAVRVQATLTRLGESAYSQPRANPEPPRTMGESGVQAFAELRGQLRAGPLADAVARLLRNHRG